MWADTITQSFFQTCKFLDICGNNGITLNPKKFQFARDEVELAGFTITYHSVRPAQKFLKAIEEFPTPADITGIRSWFGLVNQVSYAFSLTDVMQPFRELLKPGNKFFCWIIYSIHLNRKLSPAFKTGCEFLTLT